MKHYKNTLLSLAIVALFVPTSCSNASKEFSIHTDLQSEYLNGKIDQLPDGIGGKEELSHPSEVKIKLHESKKYNKESIKEYKLLLSNNEEFSSSKLYSNISDEFTFKNLNINQKYFYKYIAVSETESYESDIQDFYIKNEAPRNLKIDGITNVRDIGGWKVSKSNKYINQDLIYRCGRLHSGSNIEITNEGIQAFQELGIKTEIDLRNSGENSIRSESVIPNVSFKSCPLDFHFDYLSAEINQASIRSVFEIFADKTNYPVIFHCSIGTDRTGLIAFLLNGLLGVEVDDLVRDYMFSNFAKINESRDPSAIYNYRDAMLNNYNGGNNLVTGIENYLKTIGVTDEQIQNIRTNLVS